MKRKRLIIIILSIGILSAGLVGYSKWHTFFPSQQMKALKQLEASLDLPKPKYRSAEDVGKNKDWKGAVHYDRHIALSYEDTSVLDILRAKLLNDSWEEQPVNAIGSSNYYSFIKGTGDAMQCVSGYTQPKDSEGVSLYISLEASGEYSCNPVTGV